MEISDNLSYLISTCNKSMRQIGNECNIDYTKLSRIVRKKNKNYFLWDIIKICDYFNVSIDDFVKKDLAKLAKDGQMSEDKKTL